MRTLMKASRNSGKACIERMLISISPRHVLVLASRPLALALRRSCRGRRWQFRLRFAIAGIGAIAAGCQLQAPPQAMPHLRHSLPVRCQNHLRSGLSSGASMGMRVWDAWAERRSWKHKVLIYSSCSITPGFFFFVSALLPSYIVSALQASLVGR